ncbi:hypothetical protein HGRIS_006371 [Hohenbuehelia grisea]|uniref:F-box domain-containing protein n=1 Tax=Hohenbuehelia grisea TaxID=104357 RepID=A0ABR3K1F9_9AGAR
MSTMPALRPSNSYNPTRAHRPCAPKAPFTGYTRELPSLSIPRLREAILSLDSKMAMLMNQRHELESHLEQAVRLQSPVLRLPSELLASIFMMAVLDMGDENPVLVSTLMLVCHYWSDVAVNTPVLWAKIAVSPLDSLAKARRRLARSKSCPIDVTINYGPRFDYTHTSVTEQVIHAMDLIRPALWRVRSFSLSVPNRPQAHAALIRCQEDAPMLESLHIHVFHPLQDDSYSRPPLPLFNANTPLLRTCSLTSFNFAWDLRLVSRLRVLKLGGYFNATSPDPATLLAILRACPDLEELAIKNVSDVDVDGCRAATEGGDAVLAQTLVHLPRLKKISLYYAGPLLMRQVMSLVSLPALESLELSYLENVTPMIQLLYAQSLTRLPLRHLRIESCLFSEIKLVNLLRRAQSLESLELVEVEDVTSGLLKGLTSSQPLSCPKLETLSLDGCTNFDWDSLRGFVESRLPANSHAYPQPHRPKLGLYSSASAAAAVHAQARTMNLQQALRRPTSSSNMIAAATHRLRVTDVTRCSQISKEMVQWLRMYVADVRCEPAKGVWGDSTVP